MRPLACVVALLLAHASCVCRAAIEPFPLGDVRVADQTMQSRYAAINSKYLLDLLDPDRLLWAFRANAGLPTPGLPFVGSWEDPGCELRGHFVGHYLSALALAWSSTGEGGRACFHGGAGGGGGRGGGAATPLDIRVPHPALATRAAWAAP